MESEIRKRSARSPIWWILGLVSVAIVAAVAGGAMFISDGSYFLLSAINSQQVEVPHLRITFAILLYPAVVATHFTEDFAIIRVIYSLSLMFTPLLSIGLSWWVVRKDRRSLFVFAVIGILLVNLPGQMHWVATSIRTNQLFWPLLLAILIGMPGRVIPMAVILSQLMLLLHPHAAAYFLAGSLAALVIGWQQPELRSRMQSAAAIGVFLSIFRLLIPSTDYESSTSGLDFQLQLLERSVGNWAGVGLVFVALAAVAIAVGGKFKTPPKWFPLFVSGSMLAAGVSFGIWASNSGAWRNVSDYRGANLVFSLLLMGLTFLFAMSTNDDEFNESSLNLHNWLTIGCAIIFCLTISVQSLLMSREVNRVSEIMAVAGPGCIPESSIEGFDSGPLFQSTFPSTSLLLQSRQPNRIVLPDAMCTTAIENGNIPMFRNSGSQTIHSGWIDLWTLQYSMSGTHECWVNFADGWHARENATDGGWGRWSREDGLIRITVDKPTSVAFTTSLRTFIPDTTLEIRLNDQPIKEVTVGTEFQTILPITLDLQAGDNWLELRSNQSPTSPPKDPNSLSQDPRTMTFMIWNPSFRFIGVDATCMIR